MNSGILRTIPQRDKGCIGEPYVLYVYGVISQTNRDFVCGGKREKSVLKEQ